MILPNEKFLKDHGIEDWGRFNVCPTPIARCDMDDFWRKVLG
jgi:hypothetical protein